jgi:hypothetical protein
MRAFIIFNILIYGLIAFGAKSFMNRDNSIIAKNDVPRSILKTFKNAYPDAVVRQYQQSIKDGEQVYEISFAHANKDMEVRYAPNGQLLRTEELISIDSLPGNVRMAVARIFDDAPIRKAARVVKDNRLYYDVKLSGSASTDWPPKHSIRFTGDARLLTDVYNKES